MKPLIVAWLEQMDELVGDNHVKALDGVGGKLACDANGAGFGRTRAPARLHAAHGNAGSGDTHCDFVCAHHIAQRRGDLGCIELVDAGLELIGR